MVMSAHRANGLTGSLADGETVEVLTHTSMAVLVDRESASTKVAVRVLLQRCKSTHRSRARA